MKYTNVGKRRNRSTLKGTMRRLFPFMKPTVGDSPHGRLSGSGRRVYDPGPYTWPGHGRPGGGGGQNRDTPGLSGRFSPCCCSWAASLLAFLFNYSGQFIVAGVAERTMHDLHGGGQKIRRLPLALLTENTLRRCVKPRHQRCGTPSTPPSSRQPSSQLITAVCTMIFIFVMMLVVQPILTSGSALRDPLLGFVSMKVVKHSRKYFRDSSPPWAGSPVCGGNVQRPERHRRLRQGGGYHHKF